VLGHRCQDWVCLCAYLKVYLDTDKDWRNLKPYTCIETELRLFPLASGYVRIQALRIIDVGTSESIDVRDLPDIVVEDR